MKATTKRRKSGGWRSRRLARLFILPLLTIALLLTCSIESIDASVGSPPAGATSVTLEVEPLGIRESSEFHLAQFRSEWLNREFREAQAPISLDGRRLFFISRAGEYPADVRADLIERQLQRAVESREAIEVEVRNSNEMPAIFLGSRQLLTVTDADVPETVNPETQAHIWAHEIELALQQARRERNGKFIQKSLIYAAIAVVFVLALNRGLSIFWHRYREPLRQQLSKNLDSEPDESVGALDLLLSLSVAIVRFLLWGGALLYITNLFPFTRQVSYRITEALSTTFTSGLLTLGERSYSVIDLLILTAMLLGLVALSGIVTNLLRSRVLRYMNINRGAKEVVAIMSKYGFIFIGAMVVLQIWGLDISSLTIVVSALGVAIGFGFQDIAKNFGSGLVLLFERPIQVGDFVEVADYSGTVERIGSRSTMIRTLDQISIIVPNSRFLETEVINWSHSNPVSRLHLPVGVSYGASVQAVEKALLDAAKAHPDVLLVPAPRVMFIGFGDSSLDFELLVWNAEPSKQYFLKSDLYFRIFSTFAERNIEIPFPQRDLHVRSGNLPVQLSPQLEQALLQLLQRFGDRKSSS
ncbi:mechanosensitive ion channel family protein [Phormidium sp. CCY1219]|uniref:mechanosensitive ion channel family protein n=1 Tax=Phormidium sp. CCY1219 TaxID=2886104 RepID=UPI002D1F0DE7|nr:mechanosensitive ion channel domain-containing protein [Phormidium sp. CCY1219]MEB3831318.1 mechanosensitive ion channel [Phormidium sp. CCY1219]